MESIHIKQSPFPSGAVAIELVKNDVYLFGLSGCYTVEIGRYQQHNTLSLVLKHTIYIEAYTHISYR